MKCILYDVPGDKLNMDGALINAIEYFLYLYEQDKSFTLCLIGGSHENVEFIDNVVKERYDTDDIENFVDNIKCIRISDVIKTRFKRVLLLDAGAVKRVRNIIKSDRVVVISDRYTNDPSYMISRSNNNTVYYGEMPFEYRDVDYTMKFLFHRYKPILSKNGVYVSTHIKDMSTIISMVGNSDFVVRDSNSSISEFMSSFNKMIYITTPDRVDPSPRLFIECKFYGKEVEYINQHDIRDGGWYRYQDFLTQNIEDRYFREDDEVVRKMLS